MGHGFCRVADRCGLDGGGDSVNDGSRAHSRRYRRSKPRRPRLCLMLFQTQLCIRSRSMFTTGLDFMKPTFTTPWHTRLPHASSSSASATTA
eukprot:3044249-Pleurochrysis_carterae.AAC.1